MRFRKETPAETPTPVDFDLLLGDLADNMRVYDRITTEEHDLKAARAAAFAVIGELDPSTPLDEYSPAVAYSALETMLIAEHLKLTSKRLAEVVYPKKAPPKRLQPHNLQHQPLMVRAETADPELYPRPFSAYQIREKWFAPEELVLIGKAATAEGYVKGIHLGLKDGGSLRLNTAKSHAYLASPLIDRKNGYRPTISIKNS